MSSPHPIRRRVIAALVIAVLALVLPCAMADGPKTAPDFSYEDVNPGSPSFGETITLSDVYPGKGVVLNFIASWCPPCWRELPSFQKLGHDSSTPVVLVAADEHGPADDLLSQAAALKVDLPIVLVPKDEIAQMESRYDHSMLPATYMIDPEGKVRQVFQGMISESSLFRAAGRHYPNSGVKVPAGSTRGSARE